MDWNIRRLLVGRPINRNDISEQKVSVLQGLAIFSSDALSSVAYATEEMLQVLILAGIGALTFSTPIALAIVVLILIVGVSFRQAIQAYPNGGGAYVVARENLGKWASLIAAGALMIDYTLTVAVSVTAGIEAITSAFPSLFPYAIDLCILVVIVLTWMNIRGLRDSAKLLSLPTYLFILFMLVLIGVGFVKYLLGDLHPIVYSPTLHPTLMLHTIGVLLILRAFSSGCSAMTGIEAVSNGVTAFKTPASRNAQTALVLLIILLAVMFMGTTILSHILMVKPELTQTVLSQVGHAIFSNSWAYYGLQLSTCLILLLAANTSFAGFPILASMISRDGYLPKQLQNVGDRFAFSNGIILLALLAIILIILFNADTNALIPLYSIGVFLAFTLCQAGLVIAWHRRREKSWFRKACVNGFGCLATAIASLVIIESKFMEGAWIVLVAMPILLYLFYRTSEHYLRINKLLTESLDDMPPIHWGYPDNDDPVVVPVSKLHRGTFAALEFAHNLSRNVIALAIDTHSDRTQKLQEDWIKFKIPSELLVLESPYQSTIQPLVRRISRLDKCQRDLEHLTTVIVPKAIVRKWWHHLLHNQRTFLIRMALNHMSQQEFPGATRVFVEVPYYLPA